jgi:hypothetical protein
MESIKSDMDALAEIREAYFDALEETVGTDAGEGEARYSIESVGSKKYVRADREVIKGSNPRLWAQQVESYINNEIRQNRDVVVYAGDGDALSITRDTAGKASFRNEVKLSDGTKRLLTDEEYAVKLRAEAHIDELAQVSVRGKKTVPDYKNHAFARDGFNYRTAYFMDKAGYYRLTISVGKNGTINTIYNVGRIKEADFPLGAQRPSGNSASKTKVSQKDTPVNTSIRETERDDTPVSQAISSAGTSLNQVPALFKDKNAVFGAVNIDIGGGRFNATTDYLRSTGTENMVFDPYNRDAEENTDTLAFLQGGERADTTTIANVLNVIAEPGARANVILQAAKAIKPGGVAYFTVYEGDGGGAGKQTTAGWQNNRKTSDYVSEIEQYFTDVERKGKLIIAKEPVENLPKALWETTPGTAVRFIRERLGIPHSPHFGRRWI